MLSFFLMTPLGLDAQSFTSGAAPARQFGVHEIVLTGENRAPNPFRTPCETTFTAPSGQSIAVDCFYDGGKTWRARAYVLEKGTWRWSSESTDPGLDGQRGSFEAIGSDLRGKLRVHRADPKQWMTDNGQWFLNMSDTAYRLFNRTVAEDQFRAYLGDVEALGFSSLRAAALGGWKWQREARYEGKDVSNWPWAGEDQTRFDLTKFQTTDRRLRYMLDHHPDLYVQMILFGLVEWNTDRQGHTWQAIDPQVRKRTMRYMLARWAAFPQVFWLIVNDLHVTDGYPKNRAFARSVGQFIHDRDPWGNLLAAGPARGQAYPFTSDEDLQWSSYIHLETNYSVSAAPARDYADVPLHVFDGEDRYEHDYAEKEPRHPRYFYRRLFWSWLLSGGSSNYGGRFPYIHPYRQTGDLSAPLRDSTYTRPLRGADSLIHIRELFQRFDIELAGWTANDRLARDAHGHRSTTPWLRWLFGDDSRRVQCLRRDDRRRFLVYHPNAAGGSPEEGDPGAGRTLNVDPDRRARLRLDLSDVNGLFQLHWLRARDGVTADGGTVHGGAEIDLEAPWKGEDVVAYLEPIAAGDNTP